MKAKITFVGDVRTYMKQDGTQGKIYDIILETEHFGKNGGTYTQEYAVGINPDRHAREQMQKFCQDGTKLDCDIYFHANSREGRAWQNISLGNISLAL